MYSRTANSGSHTATTSAVAAFRFTGAMCDEMLDYRSRRKAAKAAGLKNGLLIFEVLIDKDGVVTRSVPLSCPAPLPAIAQRTLAEWHFSKPQCGGKNVSAIYNVSVCY